MKTAIGFLTKDRVELSRRTIEPLLCPDLFDLYWFDGSQTEEGRDLQRDKKYYSVATYDDVVGGPDAAVAFALTTMLKGNYDVIGLCENDVLLHPDWYGPTRALFERGRGDGLVVGAASARAYEDRVLIQRDGYAVMHNLGWGTQLLTREAAKLTLACMRTGWTTDNRRTFAQLAAIDIGAYWAFRGGEHHLCADWNNDRVLASHGLASLALTPSPCEMIGQVPPLHEQGLRLVERPVDLLRNAAAFVRFSEYTAAIREGWWRIPQHTFLRDEAGYTIFPHQVPQLGGCYAGDWRLKWTMGLGPFAWKAGFVDSREAYSGAPGACPTLTVPVSGPCDFLVSGGEHGGKACVEDLNSGFSCEPELRPEGPQGELMAVVVPAAVSYREVRLTALTPGVVFYGLRVREQQPRRLDVTFDHSTLPPI